MKQMPDIGTVMATMVDDEVATDPVFASQQSDILRDEATLRNRIAIVRAGMAKVRYRYRAKYIFLVVEGRSGSTNPCREKRT